MVYLAQRGASSHNTNIVEEIFFNSELEELYVGVLRSDKQKSSKNHQATSNPEEFNFITSSNSTAWLKVSVMPIDSTGKIIELPDVRDQWDAVKDAEPERGFFVKVEGSQLRISGRFPIRESAMSRYSGILRIQLLDREVLHESSDPTIFAVCVTRDQTGASGWAHTIKIPGIVLALIIEIASWLKGSKSVRSFLSKSTDFARALGSQQRLSEKSKQVQLVRLIWLVLNLIAGLAENALETKNSEHFSTSLTIISTILLAIYLQNAISSSTILTDLQLAIASALIFGYVVFQGNSVMLL